MKRGFTMAEILITLGIVGVISAMTIPSVINKYQERVTVNKVKKFYSMISQAFLLSVKDNGYANEWNVDNHISSNTATQIAPYFKPYLKVIKDCGTDSGCLGYKENINLLKGTKHTTNYDTDNKYYKMILLDGSYFVIRSSSGTYCKTDDHGYSDLCGAIFTDTNGEKQPNTVGKDIFIFVITPFAIKPSILNDCNKNGKGWGCSGYILKNDNINYLK